jgi:mannose-6-phosphate isomerase-like protein (cupin superfamily)
MQRRTIAILGAISMLGLSGIVAYSKPAGQAAGTQFNHGGKAPDAPTDKTAFWSSDDIDARWKENEAKKFTNSRLFNGPMNESANVRIVIEGDGPLVHPTTADLWIVQAGTATAVTDGVAVGPLEPSGQPGDLKAKSITNPTERKVHAGDVLYVPPGVPHYFKDITGFRAFLIRFDTKFDK